MTTKPYPKLHKFKYNLSLLRSVVAVTPRSRDEELLINYAIRLHLRELNRLPENITPQTDLEALAIAVLAEYRVMPRKETSDIESRLPILKDDDNLVSA